MALPVYNALRYVSLELSLVQGMFILHRHTVIKVDLVGERGNLRRWNVPDLSPRLNIPALYLTQL